MTSPEPPGPERVAVLGTGLIGTSIALAAARAGCPVTGWDPDPEATEAAASRGDIRAAVSPETAVEEATLVVVASPVAAIPEMVRRALTAAPDAIVTDAGSVKSPVMDEVARSVDPAALARFVPGHPMTGVERSGPDHAAASLIDGAVWVVTPGDGTDPAATARIEVWVELLGAVPVRMAPERHDRVVALVSHLPQITSTVLMGLAGAAEAEEPGSLLLAAGGFRDLTRLAASSPALWSEILLSNREAVLGAIDAYLERVGHLRGEIERGDAAGIERTFAEAGRERARLAAKPKVRAGVVVVQVPIPDRPGSLALLTASMAEQQVNIEDLQIVHSAQGDRGVVYVTVAEASAGTAVGVLTRQGFEPVPLD